MSIFLNSSKTKYENIQWIDKRCSHNVQIAEFDSSGTEIFNFNM